MGGCAVPVTGSIKNFADNLSVAGAVVTIQGSSATVTSDAAGSFSLDLKYSTTAYTLTVTMSGFVTQTVIVTADMLAGVTTMIDFVPEGKIFIVELLCRDCSRRSNHRCLWALHRL
jgi:hypothetical protein